jgi:hypothetical protein
MYQYEISARMYFVPTEQINSKGNPVCIPVVVRKMFLSSDKEKFPFPKKIKVVRFFRGDDVKYSVSYPVEPPKELWPLFKLRSDPQTKWKRHETMGEEAFLKYLTFILGGRAPEALNELITRKPTSSEEESDDGGD